MATGLSDGETPPSPHIPQKGQRSLSGALEPAEWLPVAFFDSSSADHRSWSMAALHQLITGSRPHIDRESKTVYGGPLGVRTVAFALSRIAQNLGRLARGEDVPRAIARVAKGPNRIWSQAEAARLSSECVAALRRDIAKSRGVLELSYKQRASQWEEMIRLATEQHLQRGTVQQRGIKHDKGPSATSGVPEGIHLLLDMHEALAEKGKEALDGDHEEEASILVAERQEETLRETRELAREQSAEYIDIFQHDHLHGSGEKRLFHSYV